MPKQPFEYSENKDGQTIHIRKPSLCYLDQFVGLTCAGDLLNLKLFPNAKEITESMAAYAALRKRLEARLSEPLSVLVVGDGSTPRTGALIAFRSRWNVTSVDPNINPKNLNLPISRLRVCKGKVEELEYALAPGAMDIVVAVHSHAKILPLGRLLTVEIPCCHEPMGPPSLKTEEYWDWGIHSERRQVLIYNPAAWATGGCLVAA